MTRLRMIREKINLFLYSSKERNLKILQYLSFIVSLSAVALLVYYYGFPLPPGHKILIVSVIRLTLLFYVLGYAIKILYAFNPRQFVKDTWFEGLLMLILFVDFISRLFTGSSALERTFITFGFQNFRDYYIVFIQLYLLIMVAMDIGKAMTKIPRLKMQPSTMFIFSFMLLIFGGAMLLMLPQMTRSGISMTFMEALFTSISASCVTGLMIIDASSFLSDKGQFVVMMLVQLGGLSIISFASFFAMLAGSGVGIRHQSYLKDVMSAENLSSSKGMVTRIIAMSLSLEVAGAFLIYFLWQPEIPFTSVGDKMFYSVFHAISAFNNAGITLFPNGMFEPGLRSNYVLQIVITVLIILGGLGFPAIRDLFGIDSLRERMRLPWKQIRLGTKIALYTSIFLLVIGTLAFFVIERHNSMEGLSFAEQLLASVFQSAASRTAGFNTVDMSLVSSPMLILFVLLMFIGASPGSTGGGIKTTTFTLLIFSAWATIRGKKNLELGKFFISYDLLNRAYTVAFFSSGVVFLGAFILSITDPAIPILELVFETVSAFATVGLSTGITPYLSPAGKVVLMVCMFVGRVGILTLAFSLSRRVSTSDYKYPNAHIMVG